jgi:hypothetical protein
MTNPKDNLRKTVTIAYLKVSESVGRKNFALKTFLKFSRPTKSISPLMIAILKKDPDIMRYIGYPNNNVTTTKRGSNNI